MDNLHDFPENEIKLIKDAFNQLMQETNEGEHIITGFNYYYSLAHPTGLLICINYQHRHQNHLEELLVDFKNDEDLIHLISPERTSELKLTRTKKAVYIYDKSWPLKNSNGELDDSGKLIEFNTGEVLDRTKLENANCLNDIPEYRYITIAKEEVSGIELNLNIKTNLEAKKTLNLFKRKGFKFKMTKDGLFYYHNGEKVLADEAWINADEIPCIILGNQISNFFPEGLPDFKEVHKIALIKGENEISFCIHNTYPLLINHSAYEKLKNYFGSDLHDIIAYANNAFVKEYMDGE